MSDRAANRAALPVGGSTVKVTRPAAKPGGKPAAANAKAEAPELPPRRANQAVVMRKARASAAPVDARPVRAIAERAELIRLAAYYRAEARGFAHGHDQVDWLAAEREVDAQWRFEG
jgi:hypothetical protein